MTETDVETAPAETAPAETAPTPPSETEAKERSPLSPGLFARLVLVLIGLIWLALGLWAFADPVGMADGVDFDLETDLARLEFRAMYGGLSIAIAALHLAGVARRKWMQPALMMSLATMVGLSSGRLVSISIDGFPGVMGLGLLGSETVGIALVGFAMFRLMRE